MENNKLYEMQYKNEPEYLLAIIFLIIIPSAIIHGILGIDEKTIFLLFVPVTILIAWMKKGFKVNKVEIMMVLILITNGVIASVLTQRNSQLLMGISIGCAVIAGRILYDILHNDKIMKILSYFTLLLLIGGVLGIIYTGIGGKPLIEIAVGYRISQLYFTTFSFAYAGNFIRPSGIFDEPGAFSMYVAIVTMFNDTLNKNNKINTALIILMIFTGSMAGLFLSIIYFIFSNTNKNKRNKRIKYMIVTIFVFYLINLIIPNNPISLLLEVFYSDRLQFSEGGLKGDNRSNQISNFIDIVNWDILINGSEYVKYTYRNLDFSSNPFSITYAYGLLISVPYFILIIWLVWLTIINRFVNSYTTIGLIFLLLQRPYIYHMAWNILIFSVIWLIINNKNYNRN